MDEMNIARFLVGDIAAESLELEARESVENVDEVHRVVYIQDMSGDFVVTRDMVLRLLDAAASAQLSSCSLEVIAFALLASNAFTWSDDLVAEILHDWSVPEVNWSIDASSLAQTRRWLEGAEPYPDRPVGSAIGGKVVRVTTKASDHDRVVQE